MDNSWRDYKIKFGKYKGWTLDYIRTVDPDYVIWMASLDDLDPIVRNHINTFFRYIEKVDPGFFSQVKKGVNINGNKCRKVRTHRS